MSKPEATYDGACLRIVRKSGTAQRIMLTPKEMKAVSRAFGEWNLAQRKAWEKEQREAGQVWLAKYWVHHAEITQEFFSEKDAREFLRYGWDYGELAPDDEAILCPDGTVIPRSKLRS